MDHQRQGVGGTAQASLDRRNPEPVPPHQGLALAARVADGAEMVPHRRSPFSGMDEQGSDRLRPEHWILCSDRCGQVGGLGGCRTSGPGGGEKPFRRSPPGGEDGEGVWPVRIATPWRECGVAAFEHDLGLARPLGLERHRRPAERREVAAGAITVQSSNSAPAAVERSHRGRLHRPRLGRILDRLKVGSIEVRSVGIAHVARRDQEQAMGFDTGRIATAGNDRVSRGVVLTPDQ